MRDTLFISHAAPEDNEFTIWLASRLELLGYKVWIDKKELLGGETFWEIIENAIAIDTSKFLLVYSKNICYSDGSSVIKTGIQKEIDFAKKVMTENPSLKDFFIILHLDDSAYDLFPCAKDLNQIAFNENWAEGLKILQKKLQRDDVSKSNPNEFDEAANWYLENYIVKNPIIEKKELYYTNWWSIESLPDTFYILRYKNELQAQKVAALNKDILLMIDANCLTVFKSELQADITDNFGTTKIEPIDVFAIKISDLSHGYEKETFPSYRDAGIHFKKLLKRALHNFLKGKQLSWYEMANKNIAYYHTLSSLPTSKVTFSYPYSETGRKKTKKLFGKHLDIGKWHFAASVKSSLLPFLGFHLKSHLIFSKRGFQAIEDKDLQHMHRRKKGKRMFNEEWRDLMLAFIKSIGDPEGKVILPTSTDTGIIMKLNPEMFWSDFGYSDPKDLERQQIFVDKEREEINENLE
jgi:hypothetical protein